MYLVKETYVANSSSGTAEQKFEVRVDRGGKPYKAIKPERVSLITEDVAYWRKASAIHRWFVENVQDGVDDCGSYLVEVEQLKQLVDTCKQVLATIETVDGQVNNGTTYHGDGRVEEHMVPGRVIVQSGTASQLLPPTSGLFFGGTDYDEYYLQDLESTVAQLEPVLAEYEDEEFDERVTYFSYRSSW